MFPYASERIPRTPILRRRAPPGAPAREPGDEGDPGGAARQRGFLSGFLDVMDRTDDSFGVLGDLCISAGLPGYLGVDWRAAGMAPRAGTASTE